MEPYVELELKDIRLVDQCIKMSNSYH